MRRASSRVSRVHGGFGAFIPLGIKIGPDAVSRLDAKPRELTVLYYDNDAVPCACCADGVAIATYASVGQFCSARPFRCSHGG
jgi:formylmethanofuran dehydrogenase subunit E